MALIVKHFKKRMTRALLGKALVNDNHRLLLYHNNGSLRYNYHTIDIINEHWHSQTCTSQGIAQHQATWLFQQFPRVYVLNPLMNKQSLYRPCAR